MHLRLWLQQSHQDKELRTRRRGKLCLGPRTETEKCGKPACKKYKFLTEDEVPKSVTKVLGTFEERSEQFEGRPSFKQKETKLQDGVFLFFDTASAEWRVSPGKTGRISGLAKPVLRNPQNTVHPPAEGWQLSCEECDQNSTVRLTEGTIDPCQEVKVALLEATSRAVEGKWGKKASGSYHHYGDWVLGRPVYYKTEAHNFTLSVLQQNMGHVGHGHEAWGFSDRADTNYGYIVASTEEGNRGPNSPGDVDRWDYFAGQEWKEKGLDQWPEANMTVECIEQNTFLDQ